jgi:hypothetical protein
VPEGLAGDAEHAGGEHYKGYKIMVGHLVELIGSVKLAELKVRDVDFALAALAKRLSTRSVRLARTILIQARRTLTDAPEIPLARPVAHVPSSGWI